jgi:hypothetical protein
MKKYSSIQLFLIRMAEPTNFILNFIGAILIIKGLWKPSFLWFILGIALTIIGYFYSIGKKANYEDKRLTQLEKFFLSVTKPVNGILHIFALLLLIFSLLKHNWGGIIIAIVVIIIGHLYEKFSKLK